MRYITTLEKDNNIILQGDRYVTSLADLYQVLIDKETTEIVLKKDFCEKHFTVTGLQSFIENANTVNDHCNITIDEVLPLLYTDNVKELSELRSYSDFMNAMQIKPEKILDTIQMLCSHYTQALEETLIANNKLSTLYLNNINLEGNIEELSNKLKHVEAVKKELETKLKTTITRINYNYQKDVDANEIMQVTGSQYNKVLYIKEISRIHFTDTLIYYLQEVLRVMYGVPCRLCVIENYYGYEKKYMYPNCVPHTDLTVKDVYQSDIFMAGFQPKLMKSILNNPSHMTYLIILDRCGYHAPHIYGDRIEMVWCASDPEDLSGIKGINANSIITYGDNTLNIPFIPNFNLLSLEERMQTYSSMDIIRELINKLERR